MARAEGRKIVNYKTSGPQWTALHFAAMSGNHIILALLLRNGAAVDALTKDGWTAIQFASHGGHTECVRLLCNAGADIHYADPANSETPLHMACREGHKGTSELLLERGSQLCVLDCNGVTPLAAAVMRGFQWHVTVTVFEPEKK